MLVDEQGIIVEWNRAQEEITGILQTEAIGQPSWEVQFRLVSSLRRAKVTEVFLKQYLLKILETGQLGDYNQKVEITIETASGLSKTILQSTFPIKTEKGYHVGTIMSDITERKVAEEKLQKSEANLRAIFDHAPVGIFQSTPQGRFKGINPWMARIYGFDSPEEMICSISDISRQIYADSEDRQEFQRNLNEQGIILDFIGKNLDKKGNVIWTQTTALAIKDDQGNILHYEGFITDISKRKQAEDKLQQVTQSLSLIHI